jgi:hypothetical protein
VLTVESGSAQRINDIIESLSEENFSLFVNGQIFEV